MIDESSYSWIKDAGDREAVRLAITGAVRSKYDQATLESVAVKNDVSSGHYKAVVVWRNRVAVSADDLNYILEASPRIEDIIVSQGASQKLPTTVMTVLIRATDLAPSAGQSDGGVYTRAKKRAKTSE